MKNKILPVLLSALVISFAHAADPGEDNAPKLTLRDAGEILSRVPREISCKIISMALEDNEELCTELNALTQCTDLEPENSLNFLGLTRSIPLHRYARINLTPDGKKALSASWTPGDRTDRLWDTDTGDCLYSSMNKYNVFTYEHPSETPFSSDGSKFIVVSEDKQHIYIRDTNTTARLATLELEHPALTSSPCFVNDDEEVAVISNGRIHLFDAQTGGPSAVLVGPHSGIPSHISPDATTMATHRYQDSLFVDIWNLETREHVTELEAMDEIMIGHGYPTMVFSPDSKIIATIPLFRPDDNNPLPPSFCTQTHIWNTENGNILTTLRPHVLSLDFSPDSNKFVATLGTCFDRLFYSYYKDKQAHIYNTRTGNRIASLEQEGMGDINSTCFGPHSEKIVTTSNDGMIRIWNAETGDCLLRLEGRHFKPDSACFNSQGTEILTSAASEASPILLDAETGKRLAVMKGASRKITSIFFSPDGKKAYGVSPANSSAYIWNLDLLDDPRYKLFRKKEIDLEQALFLLRAYHAHKKNGCAQLAAMAQEYTRAGIDLTEEELAATLESFGPTIKRNIIKRYKMDEKPKECTLL